MSNKECFDNIPKLFTKFQNHDVSATFVKHFVTEQETTKVAESVSPNP